MRILIIERQSGRTEIAVADKDVVDIANILEESTGVKSFNVDGMNCSDQPKAFGAGGFLKWKSPVQKSLNQQ